MGVGIQNVEQISDRTLTENLADIEWLVRSVLVAVAVLTLAAESELPGSSDWCVHHGMLPLGC